MIKDAKAKAVTEAREEIAREDAAIPKEASGSAPKKGQSVHVAYVPKIVKDEIRKDVPDELRDEVVKEVKAQAKTEQWGIPAALPSWISRIQPYFDMRLRFADEFYQSDNAQYFDWQQINEDGGISQALADNEAFMNTRIDRARFRERFRLGFDAKLTDSIKAGFRFATSNQFNPVSNNQTLGNTGQILAGRHRPGFPAVRLCRPVRKRLVHLVWRSYRKSVGVHRRGLRPRSEFRGLRRHLPEWPSTCTTPT